jgi:exopolysaccharide biosynthesis WecB/TagA/CpsF family protein
MTRALERRDFLGLSFTPLGLDEAVDLIAAHGPDAPFAYVVTPNAQWMVGHDGGDPRYGQAAAKAWLVLNDSRILRLLSRLLWRRDFPVAAGSDLTAAIFARALSPADPITIIGGGEEVERRLRQQFGLQSIAWYDPPMGYGKVAAEVDRCAEFIREHPARYVFIATGAPQSDMVGRRTVELGGAVGVGLCVGGSLNFLTGLVQRAPRFWREASLEWLYRLLQNPRRHFGRVFRQSMPVLWIAARVRFGRKP